MLALLGLSLLLPQTLAREINEPPLYVSVENDPAPNCWISIDPEACIVAWNHNDTPGTMADDQVSVPPALKRVVTSIDVQGEPQEFELDPANFTVEHPVNHILNGTWLTANESLPGAIKEYVTLESGPGTSTENPPQALMVVRHFPLPEPVSDTPERVGVYSWDCRYYISEGGNWENACSYDWVRPWPPGLHITTSSDELVELYAGFLDCSTLLPHGLPEGDYCSGTEALSSVGQNASLFWKDATPDVAASTDVEKVTVEVAPGSPMESRAARLDAGIPSPTGYKALPMGTSPSRLSAGPLPAEPAVESQTSSVTLVKPAHHDQGALTAAGQSLQPSFPLPLWAPVVVVAVAAGSLLLLLAFALYHRVSKHRTLENENRLRIYEAVRNEPGIRAGTLRTRLGLGYQTILWHLKVLEGFRMVESVGDGQRRFFVNGGTFNAHEKKAVLVASAPTAKAIVEHIQAHGETPLAALSTTLNLSNSAVSETVGRLERAGILSKRRINGRLHVAPGRIHPE
jgi:predicted transcriptional regulator